MKADTMNARPALIALADPFGGFRGVPYVAPLLPRGDRRGALPAALGTFCPQDSTLRRGPAGEDGACLDPLEKLRHPAAASALRAPGAPILGTGPRVHYLEGDNLAEYLRNFMVREPPEGTP